jgi:hypothetical protein
LFAFSKNIFLVILCHIFFIFLDGTVQVRGKAEGQPAR